MEPWVPGRWHTPVEVADRERERERGKKQEQERGGAASSTAGLPGGKRERGAGRMDGRRAVSCRDRRHAEAPGWSRRGWAGRKKLRNGDGGDVSRQKSGRPAVPGGQARAEGARAGPLRRPNPSVSRGAQGDGEQGGDGGGEAMRALGWVFRTSELGGSGEQGLAAAQPPTAPARHPASPVPSPSTGQPACYGTAAGAPGRDRLRSATPGREVLEDGAKPSRAG